MKKKYTPSILCCCKFVISFLIFVEVEFIFKFTWVRLKMFYFTTKAFDLVCECSGDYIYRDSAFTQKRKFGVEDYTKHITFNKRKTLRNNLDTHLKYCTSDIGTYRNKVSPNKG